MKYQTEPPTVPDENDYPGFDEWKFVKMENGEYRFVPGGFFGGIHKDAVEDGETAIAAGAFTIFPEEHFKMSSLDCFSSTLKIGCGEKEIRELEQILGIPFKESLF